MYIIQKRVGSQWQYVLDILTSSYEEEIISFMKAITKPGETLRLVKDGSVIRVFIRWKPSNDEGVGSESKTVLRINKR